MTVDEVGVVAEERREQDKKDHGQRDREEASLGIAQN
jgi:hypothetical protein